MLSLEPAPSISIAQTEKTDARAQTQPATTQALYEGCYELKEGRWWPWGFGAENSMVTPPSRIQLLGERGTRGFEQDKLLIRTIPHQERPPGSRESSFWETKSPTQLILTWTASRVSRWNSGKMATRCGDGRIHILMLYV